MASDRIHRSEEHTSELQSLPLPSFLRTWGRARLLDQPTGRQPFVTSIDGSVKALPGKLSWQAIESIDRKSTRLNSSHFPSPPFSEPGVVPDGLTSRQAASHLSQASTVRLRLCRASSHGKRSNP